ncbi:MAG: histidine phosphatase family protein [Actinomycetes bacterium]
MSKPILVLVRHGRTEWSSTGRHTGLTDVPLDAEGERSARALAQVLSPYEFAEVRVSPLSRARGTAELAGLGPLVVDEDLVEWDYGAYEGLTTPQIRQQRGDQWRVFDQGVEPGGPGQTPGENIHNVADRARSLLARVREPLRRGPVALVGHGHALRVLATVWLGLPPESGAMLDLGTGSVSVLSTAHEIPCIRLWNQLIPHS